MGCRLIARGRRGLLLGCVWVPIKSLFPLLQEESSEEMTVAFLSEAAPLPTEHAAGRRAVSLDRTHRTAQGDSRQKRETEERGQTRPLGHMRLRLCCFQRP